MMYLKRKNLILFLAVILIASLFVSLIYSFYFNNRNRFAEAALTSLDISTLPASVAKESGNTVTVTAYDGGVVMEDYGGTVEFSSTDPVARLPENYTFKNGTKEKAFTLNGWNDDLIAHNYATIASKLSTNNVDNVYIGVYETVSTQTAYGNLYCENDFAFPGVTSSDNYDLNDFITAATAQGVDTYAWITVFGPEQEINVGGTIYKTWVDPASSEHSTFMNNLVSHLLTNYGGLKGIILDYIRYADVPAGTHYRVYEDGGSYTDYTDHFAPGNGTTIIANFAQSVAATVSGFPGKELAAETYSTSSQTSYDNWITAGLGQDYALMSAHLDFIVPLAYHIGWYGPDWVADVVNFVYGKVNPANPACLVWPKVQTWQDNVDTIWPGPGELSAAVEEIDYAKVGGLGFYEYGHTSDAEWEIVSSSWDDNGVKEFTGGIYFGSTGTYDLTVEDAVAVVSDTQAGIVIFEGRPNGSLLKASDAATVWFIKDGMRSRILSPTVFLSYFDWNQIVSVDSSLLNNYVTHTSEPNLRFRDGVLFKLASSPTVYVVENANKRAIDSATTFIDKGYSWSNILIAESQEIADAHPNGAALTGASDLPSGTLIKEASSASVYYLENGQRRIISSPTVFGSQFRWQDIVLVSNDVMDSFDLGLRQKYREGSIVKKYASPAIYFIENGFKRAFTSLMFYNGLGNSSDDDVHCENNTILEYHPTKSAMYFLPKYIDIIGDTRNGHTMHQTLTNLMTDDMPYLVLHTGDLVNNGNSASDWVIFDSITGNLRANTRYYPVIGNHEINSSYFEARFGTDKWYSLDVDNIHYVILDSNTSLASGSEQYNWLSSDLTSQPSSTRFTIIAFHHPPCSLGGLTDAVALFEANGVDVVFNGHAHLYARMVSNGIYYVISGGGGAPLGSCPVCSYTTCNATYEYVRLLLNNNQLELRAYDSSGNLIDSVDIAGV